MNRPRHILAIDQGTTSTRSIVFDDQGRVASIARRELPQHYPAAGWVEHDAEDIWRDTLATAREAIDLCGCGLAGHRRHRHHEPARNGGRVGTQHRQADSPGHRLAGPPHGRGMRAPKERRRGGPGPAAHGSAARSLFLGHEDRLAAGRGRRRAGACRARGARLRDHRCVPALAADGWPRARDRRDERVAHDVVRHPPGRLG